MSSRALCIAAAVLLHLGALWAVHNGLLHRSGQMLVPVQVLADLTPLRGTPQPASQSRLQSTAAASRPAALPPATGESAAPPASSAPSPQGYSTGTAPGEALRSDLSAAAGEPAPGAPPPELAPVELPSSAAAYLNNPKPPYPPVSKRLGEQGRVVIRILIGADGTALEARIHQSSGHERLDQTALATALQWRYLPGKRAGVPEALWFNLPFTFVLE